MTITPQHITIGLGVLALITFAVKAYFVHQFEKRKYKEEKALLERRQFLLEHQAQNLETIAEQIAPYLRVELTKNSDWLSNALRKADIGTSSDSLFSERMQHYFAEKKFIATEFVPILINRCKKHFKDGKEVFLMIDSGTSTHALFNALSIELAKQYHNDKSFSEKLTIISNNIQGIHTLMDKGRVNPKDRFSKLVIKKCLTLAGEVVPVYFAILGEKAIQSINDLREEYSEAVFIGIISGNWVRIRRTTPRTPISLVRGTNHQFFKQNLVKKMDEVFVLAPLGKVFVNKSLYEINNALDLSNQAIQSDYTGNQPYQELSIGKENDVNTINPNKIKLISTWRLPGRVLYKHSLSLSHAFEHDRYSTINREPNYLDYASKDITELPHLLFPYKELPSIKHFEIETEFPHRITRTKDFMKDHFDVD